MTLSPRADKPWCPHCECETETYVMSADDLIERGARFAITDALTGITRFRLGSQLIAADVPLCGGCDAEITSAGALEMEIAA